jgi:ATP-dependent protease ClpP protease subunit
MQPFKRMFSQYAKPASVEIDNYVSWHVLGQDFQGRVTQIFTSGHITPPNSRLALPATQACPLIEVEIYNRGADELWQPTGQKVIRPLAQCRQVSDLRRAAAYRGCLAVHKDTGPDELIIYDDIGGGGWFSDGGVMAKDVRKQLDTIKPGKPLDMRVNSPGGDAFEGMAIYNTITQWAQKNGSEVIGYNDGLCASAATVIMMAAERVVAGQTSIFMIHRAFSIAFGTAEDMRGRAEMLDRIDGQTIKLYHDFVAANGKKTTLDKMTQMVHAETYLDADEQLAEGFADEIFKTSGQAAQYAYGPARPWMHNAPAELLSKFSANAKTSRELGASPARAEAA